MTAVDALSDLTSPAFTYAKDAIYVPREPCATTGEHGNVLEYRTYNGDAEVTFAGPTRFCNDCYTWLDKASPGRNGGRMRRILTLALIGATATYLVVRYRRFMRAREVIIGRTVEEYTIYPNEEGDHANAVVP